MPLSSNQKFAALQTEYIELISYLRKRGIRCTAWVFEHDPNDVMFRCAGDYRGKRWFQEIHVSKLLAVVSFHFIAVHTEIMDTVEKKYQESYGSK